MRFKYSMDSLPSSNSSTLSSALSSNPSTLSSCGSVCQSELFAAVGCNPSLNALYFRAVEADSPQSVLGDTYARDIVQTIGLDLGAFYSHVELIGQFACLRAMVMDMYCSKFMNSHDECVVVNLTGGLDTRCQRLKPKSHVHWVEVDSPYLTAIRRVSLPRLADNVELVAADLASSSSSKHDDGSASDDFLAWCDQIPAGKPTLILMETTSWMTPKAEFDRLMRRIIDRAGPEAGGQLVVDILNRTLSLLMRHRLIPAISRRIAITPLWHCDRPAALESIHPRLRFRAARSCIDVHGEEEDDYSHTWTQPLFGGLGGAILKMFPSFNKHLLIVLYDF